ncbi:MAG: DUF488 family protein [Planctomycetota bacterium]
MEFDIRRVYAGRGPDDGTRVLIDRLWPRGLSKADAAVDQWAKTLAPSHELRRWFGHEPERFDAFATKYRAELEASASEVATWIAQWREADAARVTLVYAARDDRPHHALVLRDYLRQQAANG